MTMTTCTITKRGRSLVHLEIGGKACTPPASESRGFERIMQLRGWTAQQAFDHLMATKWARPWSIAFRLGRRHARRDILTDGRLGALHVTRNFAGTLQAFRKREGARASTSFTNAPREWYDRYSHVLAGDVHDEAGAFLYRLR